MNKKMNLSFWGLIFLFLGCNNRDAPVDKQQLFGADYRLFQGTPAWELAKAVEDGDTAKIKNQLKGKDSLVNFREPRFGETLLTLAVINKNYVSVNMLLELGADPNLQDLYFGDSPLMEASKLNNPFSGPDIRFLQLLLKHGGDPNTMQNGPKKSRQSPLMIACEAGELPYMKLLVDAGAKVDTVNEFGSSPLEAAVTTAGSNRCPDIVLYLINKGADFRKVLYKTYDGQNKYITDGMRNWHFDLGSEAYKKKMELVAFLKKNGMDYKATKIPVEDLPNYTKEYLEKY